MDEIHRGILKKFHTLCGVLGLTDDDLINVCAKLSEQANRKAGHGEIDKLRKRVMASIGAYLRATGRESNATVIKGIACRASGYDDFNKIPKERLRNLYYAFNNKVKDAQSVNSLTGAMETAALLQFADGSKVILN